MKNLFFVGLILVFSFFSASSFNKNLTDYFNDFFVERRDTTFLALRDFKEEDSLSLKKIKKVEAYFKKRNMPLSHNAETFVEVAKKYDLPYNFLPAIAVVESSGGKRDKNNNPFGWGSANIKFSDYDHAIEVVGGKLSNHKFYKNKTLSQKLSVYNQEDKYYQKKIFSVMKAIEREEIM